MLLAIESGNPALAPHVYGSIKRPRRLIRCLRSKGTMANVFRVFCELVCGDIKRNGINGMDNNQIFIWDNLQAHHAAYVHETVANRAGPRRFSILLRPQYHPNFGPIKHTICKVMSQVGLRKRPTRTLKILSSKSARSPCRSASLS